MSFHSELFKQKPKFHTYKKFISSFNTDLMPGTHSPDWVLQMPRATPLARRHTMVSSPAQVPGSFYGKQQFQLSRQLYHAGPSACALSNRPGQSLPRRLPVHFNN
jgi:hypothetical protein